MHFVGLDLAWGTRQPTGVAVLDDSGRLVTIGAVRTDEEIVAALGEYVAGPCVVAIDAPLVVTNPTGNRPCEAALNRDFARFDAGAHPSNTSKPEFSEEPRGARLAERFGYDAPRGRWRAAAEELRAVIEREGYDDERGVFVAAFGAKNLDAALLLLPRMGFVAWDDPRMVRTACAIRKELAVDGFVWRYRDPDGLPGKEGAFLPCSFWLAECLARGGMRQDALEVFEAAAATANDLGLFAEEFDPATGELLGNFPQGLTHLSFIAAAIALWWDPPKEEPSVRQA